MGRVIGLFTAPLLGNPMVAHERIVILAGKGIQGDRYAHNRGAWSLAKPLKIRHITLIAAEATSAGNEELVRLGYQTFTAAETRRNIVTSGIDLNLLVGKEFILGDVLCYGRELAEPCERPASLIGKERHGFSMAFKGRGGLRAEARTSGTVSVGDLVATFPLSSSEQDEAMDKVFDAAIGAGRRRAGPSRGPID